MTIQVAIANCYGIALASDRHVSRDGSARSTGQERKLLRLRGGVPAVMMTAGTLAILNVPTSRMALGLERAMLAARRARRPEALGQAVLDVLGQPLPRGPEAAPDADALLLSETAEQIIQHALRDARNPRQALEKMLLDIDQAPRCRDEQSIRSVNEAAWAATAPELSRRAKKPRVAAALREVPDLVGRVVVAALTRDWRDASDLYVTVGLCCPATGVPVMVAAQLRRSVGGRLIAASRLASDYEAVWKANRTVVVAQGSGRSVVEAMIDGIAEEHWTRLPPASRGKVGPAMSARWDGAHDRIAVSSLRELGGVAAGLVRGAEAVGYLTRDSEGTIAPVDCLTVTPHGVLEGGLDAGADAATLSGRDRSPRRTPRASAIACRA